MKEALAKQKRATHMWKSRFEQERTNVTCSFAFSSKVCCMVVAHYHNFMNSATDCILKKQGEKEGEGNEKVPC